MSVAAPNQLAVPATRTRRIWRLALWLAALAVLATLAVSLLLRGGFGAAALTRRLSAAFGRPVAVGSFDISLRSGPRLEANNVTVREDPRFGAEYFLRAERLTAGIRWTALLAGRIELDSLVLTRPRLNLVRTPEGQWNLENWLPWPAGAPSGAPVGPPAPSVRVGRVRVEGGRINFKRGVDKHPFALAAVDGSFQQSPNGEWRIDVEGRPIRAGVVLQEAGVIRVSGQVGGTSARLRPADLRVSWTEVSLSDALRLATGLDRGVRGALSLEGTVRAPSPAAAGDATSATQWSISGVLRLAGVHRWDLPPRDTDPALNLTLDADVWPVLARAEWKRLVLEGPSSEVRGNGFLQWGRPPANYRGIQPTVSAVPDSSLQLVSSGISLNDLFRWFPAFRADTAPEITIVGNTGLDLQVRGWPPRIERVVMATDGARMSIPGTPESLGIAGTTLRYERRRGRIELGPSTLQAGSQGSAPKATLRIQANAVPGAPWTFDVSLGGQASDTGVVLQAASALGISPVSQWLRGGWSLDGPAELRLRWMGTLFPFAAQPSGLIRVRNARLAAAFLSAPITLADARLELAGNERTVMLQGVRALGTLWNGTLRARGAEPWQFALSADTLDVTTLHAHLVPAAAQAGLLQRLTARRTSAPSLFDSLAGLRAQGEVSCHQLRLAPLVAARFRGRLLLDMTGPWHAELYRARADFFGGTLTGGLVVQGPTTSVAAALGYTAQLQFHNVDLTALTQVTPRLRGLFTGVAGGELRLVASGTDRASLLASLSGEGGFELHNGRAMLLDLPASLRSTRATAGATSIPRASVRLKVAGLRLDFEELQLFTRTEPSSIPDWRLTGAVALAGGNSITLDLRLTSSSPVRPAARAGTQEFRLTGPLTAVQVRAAGAAPTRP